MVRYCSICRGESELHYCSVCKRPFHADCGQMSRDDVALARGWTCTDCSAMSDTERKGMKRGRDDLKSKFKHIRAWHYSILDERRSFLLSKKDLLLPFCEPKKLDALICGKNGNSRASKMSIVRKSEMSLSETPNYICAELRSYQLDGVSDLLSWALRGVGGILGDEMGLGKTIQTITFISVLKNKLNINGPHLVITPLTVLQNWANEITRFAPDLTFKKLYGNQNERDFLLSDGDVLSGNFDVYLTTYETVMAEEVFFTDRWPWATVTVDEGHKLKSDTTHLRTTLMRLRCPFRLLLTGTPLQNDLHELWSLLNFILPDVFKDSSCFDDALEMKNDKLSSNFCLQARMLLENGMMIRRLKSEVETVLLPKLYRKVYVGMTDIQKRWYRSLLTNERIDDGPLTFNELWQLMAELQKIVNHPKQLYTAREKRRLAEYRRVERAAADGAEYCTLAKRFIRPEPETVAFQAEEELRLLKDDPFIKACGKLAMLDRLMIKLKNQGSRVLLFSQYTQTLNILEEYVIYRFGPVQNAYLRLDGMTTRINREFDVRNFNAPGSQIFVYLISTKAGGVGINLATADSVILYEPCYNPQVELQAEDRSHRIGQKKQVVVYKFITKDSFEEKVYLSAQKKLMLDHLVIAREQKSTAPVRRGRPAFAKKEGDNVSMTELWKTLSHGTDRIFKSAGGGSDDVLLNDGELDTFIENMMRGETDCATEEPSIINKDNFRASDETENLSDLRVSGVSTIFDFAGTNDANQKAPDIAEQGYDSEDIRAAVNNSPADITDTKSVLNGEGFVSMENYVAEVENMDEDVQYVDSEVHVKKRARLETKRYAPIDNTNKKHFYRKKSHDCECFVCDDGGELLECSTCPKVYHLNCIGLNRVPKGAWSCPWHRCHLCDRSFSACGGMLLRCISCPSAFCMDCFPTTEEMTQVQPTPQLIQYFDASGFSLAHSTVFFKCCECKQEDIIENEKREAEQKLKEAQLAEFRKRESEKERLNRERKSITLVDVKSTTPRQVVLIVPLFKDAAGKLGISLVAHNLTKQIFVQDVRSHSGQLQPFDEIVGVNGVKTTTLKEIIHQISTSPRRVQIHAVRTVGATPSWFKPLGETIDETSAAMNTGQIAARQPPVARTSNMRIENDPPLPAECILITVDRTVLESLDLFVMSTPAVELIVVSVPPSCDVIQAGDIIDRVNGYNVKGPERMKAVLNLPIFSQKKSFKVVIKRRTKVGVVKSAPKASLPVTAVAKVSDVTQSVHPPRIENVIVSIDFSVAHLIKVSGENRLIVAEVPQNCAAVKVGDIIKRVNGHPVDVASDISSVLMHPRNSSASVSLELMRVSRLQNVINLFITVFRPYNMNLQTSEYEKAVKILVPPLNSSHAILIGDRIKSVNGVKINSVQELMQISSENKFAGLHAISLEIERQVGEGDSRSLPVMPLYRPESAVDTIILPINASQDTRQMTISNDNSINAPFSGQNNAPMPNALCTKDSTLFPSNLTDDEIFATARLLDKSVTAYYSAYSKPN